jgi:hypothetical protein
MVDYTPEGLPIDMSRERMYADILAYRQALKTINAYATTPHWTTDRKYKIADLAQKTLRHGVRQEETL